MQFKGGGGAATGMGVDFTGSLSDSRNEFNVHMHIIARWLVEKTYQINLLKCYYSRRNAPPEKNSSHGGMDREVKLRLYPFFTIGLTVVSAFVLPDVPAAQLDRAALRGASPLNKPALFERNDGQFAADIAFRANFAQLDAAIHANGSFTILPKPGMPASASPVRFALSGAKSRYVARGEHEQTYRTNYFQGGERES